MKTARILTATLAALTLASLSASAFADSAFCEVKKNGEKAKKATGHCGFVDQGDRIMIDLANGENFTLTRKKDKKNGFKDQNGNGVHREAKKNGTIFFKWEHKNITVYPEGR